MGGSDGLRSYYQGKIDELSIVIQDKAQNLRRLEALRNDINSKVRLRALPPSPPPSACPPRAARLTPSHPHPHPRRSAPCARS